MRAHVGGALVTLDLLAHGLGQQDVELAKVAEDDVAV